MSDKVDARGRSCPEPIIMTKKALEEASGDTVTVLVDTAVAKENVTRLAVNSGWNPSCKEEGTDFIITCTRI